MIKKTGLFILSLAFLGGPFCHRAVSAEDAFATMGESQSPSGPHYAKRRARRRKKSAIKYRKNRKARASKNSLSRSVRYWLKKMKKRIARSHAQHNKLVAVAAVRGSRAKDAPPLYWKGKKNKGPVDLPELDEFDRAIQTALKGNRAEAALRLKKFIKAYPKSNLVDDAKQTLAMLEPPEKVE